MENAIEYYRKNVYGKELIYVKDPKTAARLEFLTGHKSLSPRHMAVLEVLGLKFVEVLAPKVA